MEDTLNFYLVHKLFGRKIIKGLICFVLLSVRGIFFHIDIMSIIRQFKKNIKDGNCIIQ
jgi:hypothetical protein